MRKIYWETKTIAEYNLLRDQTCTDIEAKVIAYNGATTTFIVHLNDDPCNETEFCISVFNIGANKSVGKWANLKVYDTFQDALVGLYVHLYEETLDDDAVVPNSASRLRAKAHVEINI